MRTLSQVISEMKLSQQQLADKIRLSRQAIRLYAKGARKPCWPIIVAISKELELDPETLEPLTK